MSTGETFGKTLPLLQRHPDAVVILWNPNDYDHVFLCYPFSTYSLFEADESGSLVNDCLLE